MRHIVLLCIVLSIIEIYYDPTTRYVDNVIILPTMRITYNPMRDIVIVGQGRNVSIYAPEVTLPSWGKLVPYPPVLSVTP